MTFTWTVFFSILASLVPIVTAAYFLLKIRLQKVWTEDIEKETSKVREESSVKIKNLESSINHKVEQSQNMLTSKLKSTEVDIIKNFDSKFELFKKDFDNITDYLRDLKSIIERYQEQQIEGQIESAVVSEKIKTLGDRTAALEKNTHDRH